MSWGPSVYESPEPQSHLDPAASYELHQLRAEVHELRVVLAAVGLVIGSLAILVAWRW